MREADDMTSSTGSQVHVLYMEDDAATGRLLQKKLEATGCAVDLAQDGEEGLAMFQASPYDVVLVDQTMPGRDGLEVIRLLMAGESRVPVIMITGTGDERIAVEAMKLGATDYIVKDVQGSYLELLPSVIEKALEQRRLVEEIARAEEALQESEARNRALLGTMPDLMFRIAGDGTFLDYRPAPGYELLLPPEEFLGKSIRELSPADEAERTMRHVQAALETGETQAFEYQELQDGVLHHYEARIATGGEDEVVVVVRDITERKQAEEALRESEELLRSVLDTNPSAVFVVDRDGRYLLVNKAFAEALRTTPEEILGATILDALKAGEAEREQAEHFMAEDAAVIDSGEQLLVPERPVRQPDGSVKWYQSIKVPLIVRGESKYMLGVLTDITERKQAEETVRESEERYRRLFEGSPVALWEEDFSAVMAYLDGLRADGVSGFREYFQAHPQAVEECLARVKVLDVNQASLELYGASSKEELMGSLQEIVPPQAYDLVGEHFATLAEGGTRFVGEIVNQTLSGETRDLFRSSFVAPGFEESLARVIVSIVDVTARKRAEEALRSERDFAESLVEMAQAIVLVLDTEGRIIQFNPYMEEMSGYGLEEVQGKDWVTTFLPKRDWDWVRELFLKAVGEAQTRGNVNPIVTKDGRELEIEWYDRVLKDADGEIVGLLSIGQDITERKLAEEALERRMEQLAALSRASQAVAASLDLDDVLAEVVSLASVVVDADYTSVVLVDDAGNMGRSAESMGGVPAIEYRVRDAGLTKWIVRTAQPTVVDEIGRDGAISPDLGEGAPHLANPDIVGAGVRSIAGLPLMVKGRLLGVLYLHSLHCGAFRDQLPLLTAFANQAAIAIENARLFKEAMVRRRYLETLQQINATLRSTLPLRQVLEAIARGAGEGLGKVGSLILVPDVSGERLVLGAVWGKGFVGAVSKLIDHGLEFFHLPLTAEENPIVQAYLSGEFLTTSGESERVIMGIRPRIVRRFGPAIARAMGARSSAYVPLVAEEKVLGVLLVFSPRQQFSEEEQAVLLGLADQAGLAIQNARLFEEVTSARERLEALSRRLVEAQEEERRRIARELHDEIGQVLTGLNIILGMAVDLPPDKVRASLDEARALVRELMAEVRDLSLDLRPAMLDDLGLLPALLWLFERYSGQTGVQVTLEHHGLEGHRFAAEVETAAYRIVQEALTNVARHAGVQQVAVRASADEDSVNLQIEDQGVGFDPGAVLDGNATSGLPGMRERAALLGGQLLIDSTPGAGVCIRATLLVGSRGGNEEER